MAVQPTKHDTPSGSNTPTKYDKKGADPSPAAVNTSITKPQRQIKAAPSAAAKANEGFLDQDDVDPEEDALAAKEKARAQRARGKAARAAQARPMRSYLDSGEGEMYGK